jgi:hypothetical protein
MPLFRKKNKIHTTKRALLVGINYRKTSGELYGCINDINNIKQILLKNNYKEENIRMLSEDHDELPTKHQIAIGLIWLMENKENKPMEIFFHYSGHGSWVEDNNGDEEDGHDECLVPIDYKRSGMLYDDQINDLLEQYLTSNTKLFTIIDACHSGTMLDLKYQRKCLKVSKINNKISTEFQVKKYNYNDKIKGKIIMISAAQDNQTAADAWLDRQSQGALTNSLVTTFVKYNYNLTFDELMANIYQVIKEYNFQQNPTLSSNFSIDLDSKVII